jgi:hydrogenase nickel incorporation protein HypA/HybF
VHEYSIASSLLRMVEEHAGKHEGARVVRLELRIGELAGVEVPLLATAWSLVRERSVCEGVDLTVERVPAVWQCAECGGEIARGGWLACGRCGAQARLCAGDELILDRIEMEVT